MSTVKIKLFSFDYKLLDKCAGEIFSMVSSCGGKIRGPIPFPIKSKRFVVNRSPHIDKKSREVYYIHTHVRVIYINASSDSDLMKSLQSIEIKAGIGIEVKNL